jgi:hypothetical protein
MKKPFVQLPALAAVLVLLACLAVMFRPAVFEGKLLAPTDITRTLLAPWDENAGGAKPHNHNPTDAVTQYLPYRIFAEESLRKDGYIGWNPYEMGGYSLAANTMALPGTWTMQLHRFLPFVQAWNWGIIAEFLIAGSGMLVFLRGRKLPWLASCLGAIAFMANSQFIVWIYHRWALGSFCWMPWVLWAVGDGFETKGLTPRQMTLPVFLTLALLGGSLQHIAFVVLACGCIAAGGLSTWKPTASTIRPVLVWGFALGLALLASAFTWLPQIQGYLANNGMGYVRGQIGYAEGPSQPAFNLVSLFAQIWPWLVGDPQSVDGWKLLKASFMDLAYLGTIPMVLAFVGVFDKAMPRAAKWLVVAGLLIPLTPLVGPLYHRVQLLFLLGGAWMAAEMIARFATHPPRKLAKVCSVAVLALGGVLLIGTCLPGKVRSRIEDVVVKKCVAASAGSQFGADSAWIERRAKTWTDRFAIHQPRTAWVYGLLVLGTAGLVLTANSRPDRRRWGQVAILTATSLELFTLFQTWTTFSPPEDLRPPHPAIDRVREIAGENRVAQCSEKLPFADVFATPNLLSAYGIPTADAYESIQYPSSLYLLKAEDPALRLTLGGVGVSVQPTGLSPLEGTETWPAVETISGYDVRKNPAALPPLLMGDSVLPDSAEALLPLLREARPVASTLSTPNRWEFPVQAGSRWIRLAQNWHAGWRWKVPGGSWQQTRKGLDGATWIDLDPSTPSTLEVRFFPRNPVLGYFSAAVAISWLLILLLVSWRRHSRCKEPVVA